MKNNISVFSTSFIPNSVQISVDQELLVTITNTNDGVTIQTKELESGKVLDTLEYEKATVFNTPPAEPVDRGMVNPYAKKFRKMQEDDKPAVETRNPGDA